MVLPKGTWPSVIFLSPAFRLTKFLVSFTELPRAEHRRRGLDDADGGASDQHFGDEAGPGTQAALEAGEAAERAVQLRFLQRWGEFDVRHRGELDGVEELHQQLHQNDDPSSGQRRLGEVLIVELRNRRPIPPLIQKQLQSLMT